MLAINLAYLNFAGRLTLRPRDVVLGGGAEGAGAAKAPPTSATARRFFVFFAARGFEALRLPI
jgi:hypothetical protein